MNTQRRTARATGAWYASLAVAGMLGFIVIRPQLYIDGDPTTTLANLANQSVLAHLGVGLEMAIIITQAMTAVWFLKLFRPINPVAAFAVAAFGLLNAAAIMASAGYLATAVAVAESSNGADAVATVALLQTLSTNAWGVGNLFFGLWLIPMGWVAITSQRMPRVLGWLLVAGGVAYLFSGFVSYAVAGAPAWAVEYPAYLATIGEFWMIGYLLSVGIRTAESPRTLGRRTPGR